MPYEIVIPTTREKNSNYTDYNSFTSLSLSVLSMNSLDCPLFKGDAKVRTFFEPANFFFTFFLLIKRIPCGVAGNYPPERVDEKKLLSGIGKLLVAVPHINIHHTIIPVGPHHRPVASIHYILKS